MIQTDYPEYTENNYGKIARFTDKSYRLDLASWQITAIETHIGNLYGKIFFAIGAGDIVLGEKLSEVGVPKKFYVQDLIAPSLKGGLKRISESGVDISIFHTLVSDCFDFKEIKDKEVDAAFSNSLFSHLTINSIILCLRNLFPKMKPGSSYFSSMIVLPNDEEKVTFDWSFLKKPMTNVTS